MQSAPGLQSRGWSAWDHHRHCSIAAAKLYRIVYTILVRVLIQDSIVNVTYRHQDPKVPLLVVLPRVFASGTHPSSDACQPHPFSPQGCLISPWTGLDHPCPFAAKPQLASPRRTHLSSSCASRHTLSWSSTAGCTWTGSIPSSYNWGELLSQGLCLSKPSCHWPSLVRNAPWGESSSQLCPRWA